MLFRSTLPAEYSSFASVFSKEATDHVPPSRPYDHEINLDDAFTPKIGKVYPLSPDERKATEDFLDENLASGKIRPSNSPQASPFFFVKKKDGGLRPCQDYRYINEHTIRDAYPLPLIVTLDSGRGKRRLLRRRSFDKVLSKGVFKRQGTRVP